MSRWVGGLGQTDLSDLQRRNQLRPVSKKSRSPMTSGGGFFALMVAPRGFEPLISWLRTRRPGPLDEGAMTCPDYS